jgi:hypothetical protein
MHHERLRRRRSRVGGEVRVADERVGVGDEAERVGAALRRDLEELIEGRELGGGALLGEFDRARDGVSQASGRAVHRRTNSSTSVSLLATSGVGCGNTRLKRSNQALYRADRCICAAVVSGSLGAQPQSAAPMNTTGLSSVFGLTLRIVDRSMSPSMWALATCVDEGLVA